jgi:DNA-binding transcriptional LysR family regulator
MGKPGKIKPQTIKRIEPMAINLRSVEIFLRVVETGGMTSAARQLGLSQSAVSQTISSLESELNVKLLNRSVRPITPTVSGSLLIERGAKLLQAAQDTIKQVRTPSASKIPHLRLALSDSVAAAIGPHLIKNLREESEKCSVFSGLSTSHRDLLLNHEVDIIISADPFEDVEGLFRQEIFSEPFILLLPSDYPKQIDNLEALALRGDLIRFSARSSSGQQIERHLRRLRIKAPQHFECDTSDAVFNMVATGIGWTITTPICLLQAQHRIGNSILLPLPKPGLNRRVTLLCREGELTGIASRIAAWSAQAVRSSCLPELRTISPWLERHIWISGE